MKEMKTSAYCLLKLIANDSEPLLMSIKTCVLYTFSVD